ncbi:response regulator transcription factor [Pseudomonas sp. H9]|uniref:response regulator transcription factor n=1 Tax=Pseudomonas sp. H9 TaxID=483968 RepID=UPI001057DBE3|nr:LuxR C-terminal-related transcriptional regulator [Pseudomonas sp. H9]TDF82376.1 LuxR family transcriptional regulator [Pseudomonas sp. H9]
MALAARLTGREVTVARLVAQGLSSKRIARELGISDLTVRKHRENVLRKLELCDTAHVAVCWPLIARVLQSDAAADPTIF